MPELRPDGGERSCHRSITTQRKRIWTRQWQPEATVDLLPVAMEAKQLKLQLEPTLQNPAPRLSLLRTASPAAATSVWPGDGRATLKGLSGERKERGKESPSPTPLWCGGRSGWVFGFELEAGTVTELRVERSRASNSGSGSGRRAENMWIGCSEAWAKNFPRTAGAGAGQV
jgi:hypothetical protein